MKKKFALILLFVVSCLVAIFYFFSSIQINTIFRVNDGDNITTISKKLKDKNIILSSIHFKIYAKIWSIANGCGIVQVGEYKFNNGEKFNSIFDKLCNGKSIIKSVTVPEGLEMRDVVDIINKNEDLIGDKIIFFEEGKILPETYSFKSGTRREILFNKMRENLDEFFKKNWESRLKNDYIKTKEEAIILASIVEKEAKNDGERPIIASVYLNRLAIDMRLESDPTTIYEITKGKYKLSRLLTRKDLKIVGNYNTYRKKGLPIAPICNPGIASIKAVLYPSQTDYLYFVAKEDLSGHYFAKNYKDHLKNIKFVKSHNSGK